MMKAFNFLLFMALVFTLVLTSCKRDPHGTMDPVGESILRIEYATDNSAPVRLWLDDEIVRDNLTVGWISNRDSLVDGSHRFTVSDLSQSPPRTVWDAQVDLAADHVYKYIFTRVGQQFSGQLVLDTTAQSRGNGTAHPR
jgi:hypothetical protein